MGSEWMSELPESLTRIPIIDLAIPGSHDSGATSVLSIKYPVANDEATNRFLNCFGKLTVSRRVIRRWAITQHVSAGAQCQMGIRYFDLRVSNPPNSLPYGFHLVHALYGPELSTFLKEIKDFLDIHPKEIVILDMNHLFQVDWEVHQELEKLIVEIFGRKRFCKPLNGNDSSFERTLDEITLEMMWERGEQVICITAFEYYPSNSIFWPGFSSIVSPYPETNDIAQLIEYLSQTQVFRSINNTMFYVTQGILTATIKNISRSPFSSLEKQLSLKATAAVRKWIFEFDHPELFNIVIVDFVNEEFCRQIVKLNDRKMKNLS